MHRASLKVGMVRELFPVDQRIVSGIVPEKKGDTKAQGGGEVGKVSLCQIGSMHKSNKFHGIVLHCKIKPVGTF